jgi:superfamily II DNA or RNA helicase
MAYHLSQEARAGLTEFRIPADFRNTLFDYQLAAVKIAAHHLNKRGGVLIGDVVGLGKTLMATALARIFEDDFDLETLIICPKNLVGMWESYKDNYRMRAKVMSSSQVIKKLPELKRYRVLILDESHNLRNREGRRFKAIQDYIQKNDCKCILLSATPYNKTYQDLSSQLRLFVPGDNDLGIRPERKIREMTELEFVRKYQCGLRTLAAFEKSEFPDDWRELMRLFMVRRTRTFIMQNYARWDETRKRYFLEQHNGTRNYFPIRQPRRLIFSIQEGDQYAKMYREEVVLAVNDLCLPRYGLGNYVADIIDPAPNHAEQTQLNDLSRAGKRLMGFCRTNLFKRLESSGAVFLESIERHIQRNFIFLYALENGLPLPIGTQDASLLDPALNDEDVDLPSFIDEPDEDEEPEEMLTGPQVEGLDGMADEISAYQRRAKEIYDQYSTIMKKRFRWIASRFFSDGLKADLTSDAHSLLKILDSCSNWDTAKDTKLNELERLLKTTHPNEKVLIFTQFADTVRYLETNLRARGVQSIAGVTGNNGNPTDLAYRFSPVSNKLDYPVGQQLRVLVATDVLSEGQNLQDAAIVVNYDLPWAIVRLIQRAGRVDRIGQQKDTINCYSFLPADGVEQIIRLRHKVQQRLRENSEVLGTDEAFFDGDDDRQILVNLYDEKAGLFDDDPDGEVDLASTAYQIWKNAIDRDPSLKKTIEEMPAVVYSAKQYDPTPEKPAGALVYARTPYETDALAWLDSTGTPVTESQYAILKAAECLPEEPAVPKAENHHDLTEAGVNWILQQETVGTGTLGNRTGARYRVYTRLKDYIENNRGTLFVSSSLESAVNELYQRPLREGAKDALNRQLKSSVHDEQLAELLVSLYQEGRLCVQEEVEGEGSHAPVLICSMGLVK